MQRRNYDHIVENLLPPMGFGGVINNSLLPYIDNTEGSNEIKIAVVDNRAKERFEFEFGRNSGPYFFLNNITATTMHKGEVISYQFRLDSQKGYSRKQMINMLKTGAVRKNVYDRKSKQNYAIWTRVVVFIKDGKKMTRLVNTREDKQNWNLIRELSNSPVKWRSQNEIEDTFRNLADGDLLQKEAIINGQLSTVTLQVKAENALQLVILDGMGKRVYNSNDDFEVDVKLATVDRNANDLNDDLIPETNNTAWWQEGNDLTQQNELPQNGVAIEGGNGQTESSVIPIPGETELILDNATLDNEPIEKNTDSYGEIPWYIEDPAESMKVGIQSTENVTAFSNNLAETPDVKLQDDPKLSKGDSGKGKSKKGDKDTPPKKHQQSTNTNLAKEILETSPEKGVKTGLHK